MKRHTLIYLVATVLATLLLPSQAWSQKWFKRAHKAQVNIFCYDATGQLLCSTNGFFVEPDGLLLTDYASLRGAARAVAIDDSGHEMAVTHVVGASALYDVVALQVDAKKLPALTIASDAPTTGQTLYVMPYLNNRSGIATTATVSEVKTFGEGYSYATLPLKLTQKSTSVPVLNEKGEVVGLLQMAAQAQAEQSFVIAANYVCSLGVTALSATSNDYRDILIRKQLPTDAAQAASFIYLVGTRDTTLYLDYTADYISRFPDNATGYVLRGEMLAAAGRLDEAQAAWQAGLDAKAAADEILYSRARSIFGYLQAHTPQPEAWTLETALSDARAAHTANPLPIYTALQGHILYAQQSYDEACRSFLSVTQTNLRSADYFLYAAQCQQMQQDTLAALELQDSAVACFTKPYMVEAAPALLMRAQTLLSLSRYREAIRDLNDYEHLKLNDLNANFYYRRAQAEMRCRMFQQALSDMERAARLSPTDPVLHAELAATYFRLNQTDEAIATARETIALDDNFADAHRILGVCLRASGKEAEARAALQRASDLGDEMARQMLTTDK